MMTGSQAPDSGKPIAGEQETCEHEEQFACCYCESPCTEDDRATDDEDTVYICHKCIVGFYQEYLEARDAEHRAWMNRTPPNE
jgi:hypothetical protein